MSALNRKMFRDLWHMRGQAIAIALVIASGVAMFIMSLSTLRSLQLTQVTYYERYRFGQVFAHLKRAPETLESRISTIPGVAEVQTRVVMDVIIDVEGLAEPAVGRLISISEYRKAGLNSLHIRRGRSVEPGRKGEVLASEAFADAHALEPGDTFRAIINGRRQELTIVGIALSPEYIFQIRGGDVMPDDKRFGVFWMGHQELASAFNMEGGFNDLSLSLLRGASLPEVLQQLDQLIEPYGGIRSYGRKDQLSHHYLSEEIKQLRGMGLVAPTIFLIVAAFLLNVVLSRLVSTQREQIAALKAFGYSRTEIGLHYLGLVLGIVLLGVVLGVISGNWLGRHLTELYTRFYRFPIFYYQFNVSVVLWGTLVSVAAAVLGTWGAVRRAVMLPPAEAMRPEPPTEYRPTLVERSGLGRWFSQTTRMILRQLERRLLKSLLSSFGIALAVAVLILGRFGADAMEYLMEFQFEISQRQDMSVTFVEPSGRRAIHDLTHLPGVIRCEAFRSLPVRLRHEHRSRELSLMGLNPDAELYRLLDRDQQQVSLPIEGMVISKKLAELLRVRPGEFVTVEVLEGKRPVCRLPVVGLVDDLAGTNAYMRLQSLNRLVHEGDTVSGAFLTVDSLKTDALFSQIKSTPRVAGVSILAGSLESFRKTMAENLLVMTSFNVIFACIIAFGVVYNTARISLSERSRELATLRVIGFTRREVSAVLLGELAVLTLVAIPVGLLMGYGFSALMALSLETDLYRIPLVISRSTFAFAALVIMMASLVSGLIVRRKIDDLDLIAVLKSRE